MDKENVFNHYCKLLDEMREESMAFQDFLISLNSSNVYHWEFQIANMECGATRAAIIDADNGYPYIVKFDIDTDDTGDSSCEREVKVYDLAKQRNLNQYFTEAVYLGEYHRIVSSYAIDDYYDEMSNDEYMNYARNNDFQPQECVISIPLYGYERVEVIGISEHNCSPENEQYARHTNSPLTERSSKIGALFLENYGEAIFKRLTIFCRAHNINDLHCSNVGYLNNKIVILDFGSYYCNS